MIMAYSLWKAQIQNQFELEIRILHELNKKRILNTEMSTLWKV